MSIRFAIFGPLSMGTLLGCTYLAYLATKAPSGVQFVLLVISAFGLAMATLFLTFKAMVALHTDRDDTKASDKQQALVLQVTTK
jgi:hypothetical protein